MLSISQSSQRILISIETDFLCIEREDTEILCYVLMGFGKFFAYNFTQFSFVCRFLWCNATHTLRDWMNVLELLCEWIELIVIERHALFCVWPSFQVKAAVRRLICIVIVAQIVVRWFSINATIKHIQLRRFEIVDKQWVMFLNLCLRVFIIFFWITKSIESIRVFSAALCHIFW